MTRYEILLFLHIGGAIVWLGSGFLFQVLGLRADASGDPVRMKTILDELNALSTRLFIPASLSVFVLGLLLVLDSPWSFGDAWVVVGLAGYAATFLTGLLLIKPQGEKIAALMERSGGAITDEVVAEIRRLLLIGRVDLVVLFVVVADMALKPSADDVGTLVVLGAAVALAAVYSVWRYRDETASRPVRETA